MLITRFAPSPTGYLHLGHAYSALTAYRKAKEAGGKFLLRIEDIDASRCRPQFYEAIYEDLHWLGISWEKEILIQSKHLNDYADMLTKLDKLGLIYRCYCTRKEIKEQSEKIFGAPHKNETIIYAGTCRNRTTQPEDGNKQFSYRLNIDKAMDYLGGKDLYWQDEAVGQVKANPFRFGDVILARKDCPTSYYMACTFDDARQNVNFVTRGKDLFEATDIQVLLQNLLGLPTPTYYHHPLICDENGQRLAKRSDAASIRSYREKGLSPKEILELIR
jgi:glutamyl-Q tRNA(Asp) synthetase